MVYPVGPKTVDEIEEAPIPRRQMEQMSRQEPAPGPQPERPFHRQEMDMAYELPPALADTDLQQEAQQYDTLNPLRVTQGVIENLMSMGSMFAGSVPGFMKGVWEATRGLGNEDDSKAAGERYVDSFLETQEFFTYEPRSVKGKKYRDALMHLFETWGEWGKKNISDPAFEAGYPNIAAFAQTSIEALPILLPLKGQVPFRGKGAKPTPPVMRPKPAETPVDAKMTFEMEAPAPEVPRGTIDLPPKVDPMKPKPVGERSMADLEPLEPLEGIKAPEAPRPEPAPELPAPIEEAPRPAPKEGLPLEERIRLEKIPFAGEKNYAPDRLSPPTERPISKQEMDLAYEQVGEKQGPSPDVTDPIRTPPETPIKARKPTKPWKAKGLDVQKDSMFDAIGKMGGLKRAEAENFLGLDPGQKLPTTVFGRPIFRKKGKAVDEMADELANEGYLDRDPVTGKVDPREFEEKFGEEAMGRKQYSRHKEYDDALFADEYQKYLEEQYKEKGDKGTTFNTGIPIEEIKTFTKRAWQKLKDALAIREAGVTVEAKPRPKPGPFLAGVRSPSQLVKKIDGLELPFKWAKAAESLNFRYKKMFNERRRRIRKILKRDGFFQYAQNKKTLHGLLMESDFLGKEFTPTELRAMAHSENMVKAYGLNRSLYDTAWKLGKKHLKEFKQPVPEYMKGYVPHYFHDWFIRDADTGTILGSAKNLQQAVTAANEMKRGGKAENIDIYPKPREFEGQEIQAAIIGDARYLQMQKKLEARFKMTPQEAQQLLGSVFKKTGKTKIFENFLDRKGVSGWVKDLDYVENRYFNMLARYLAQDKFKKQSMDYFERKFGEFDKDWRGDARYVKNYINDVLGHPTAVEEMLNKFIKNAPGFRKITENYLGDRPAHTIANNTTSVISALKLGLYNLSAAGVNLTQLNNVYAILGERAFLNGVTRAAKAQKDIAAKNWNIEMVKSPNSDLWVLKELGIDQQQGYAATEGFMPGNFIRASLYAFTKAEFINRSVAALGGFHKFMRENKHLPLKERRLKALEYAEEVNYRSNFNYGVEDAQSYLRQSGPPGKVAFQFKKFVGKQFEFMTTLKGAENPRFWIPYLVIAGYQGIPGIQSLIDLAEYFTDTDMEYEMKNALMEWVEQDDDLDRELKQAIADDVMYGAFSLAKANAASRIGLGDALTGGNIGGPAVTTVVDTIQALANENYAEAIRKFATSPGNLLKALDSKTLRDPRRRNRKIVELEPWDRVLKGIGFRTMKETIESDKSRIIGYMERKIKKEETEAITGYWNAVEDKDKEEMDKHLKKLEEMGVDWKRLRDEKIKRDFMTQSQRKLETVPRKRMLDYLDTFRYGQERKKKAK